MTLLFKAYFHLQKQLRRIWSPVTLGVRTLVIRGDEVLLVRMTYIKGWTLPGGGVDRGESTEAAAIRELHEETGLKTEHLSLFGIYYNPHARRNDHVAVYLVSEFSGEPRVVNPAEISEVRFFRVANLPPDLRAGHRQRIVEFFDKIPQRLIW